MLDRRDIEQIYSCASRFLAKYASERSLQAVKENCKQLLEDFPECVYLEKPLLAEDGGSCYGILGTCSYLFVRAACLDENKVRCQLSSFMLLPFYSSHGTTVEELSQLVMKASEYYCIYKALLDKGDISGTVILLDGSFLADIFRLKRLAFSLLSAAQLDRLAKLYSSLLAEDPGTLYKELLEKGNLHDEFVPLVYLQYLYSFLRLLLLVQEYNLLLVYFVKHPLSSRVLASHCGCKHCNDVQLLRSVTQDSFCTRLLFSSTGTSVVGETLPEDFLQLLKRCARICEEELHHELGTDLGKIYSLLDNLVDGKTHTIKYYFIYYRRLPFGQIYKIEVPAIVNLRDLKTIFAWLITACATPEGYPLLLLYAHRLVHVPEKIKEAIEAILLALDQDKLLAGKDVTRT
ncbi:MAG: DNA double-strand break repair nuclease NurA [bacterium]|nr:DNA double-strand break repair nuclease NurA [bacterium]